MFENPIISFCIPTYNRRNKVFELVNNVLKYEGTNIEVLVLDNCSTDGTKELLEKIQDSRFRFIQNEKNIGGIKNPYKVMLLAKGDFSFLCLDKDFINPKFINELIERLTGYSDIVFGHCILNIENESIDSVFERGFQSILNMSYLSAHPTGMFYKRDIFTKTNTLKGLFEADEIFGFYFELINAEMALSGKSLMINLPVFSTETREECAKTTSFTYNDVNDLFFSPRGRYKAFYFYTKHLFSLNINKKEKIIIANKLLKNSLISSTFEYKGIMNDASICKHYLLKTTNITSIELLKIYCLFLFSFFKSDLPLTMLSKMGMLFSIKLSLIYSLVKNKMKRGNGK